MTDQQRPMRSLPTGQAKGAVSVPGDKSISHRALILGALAHGTTTVTGLLESEDVMSTAGALRACGVPISKDGDTWTIVGRGLGGLSAPDGAIDFGNTGTGIRLMFGVFAGNPITVALTGDASLSARPMGRVLRPLAQMGLEIIEGDERLPLTIRGTEDLVPMRYELPVASAQVKSAVLLAGLHAPGETSVVEPVATRDHTERMLKHFGAALRIEDHAEGGRTITVVGETDLQGAPVQVPGDPSSAAFAAGAGVLARDGAVTIRDVMANHTRTGFYAALREMGADIEMTNARDGGGETIVDIVVRGGRPLKGITLGHTHVPSMVDEYPMLACIAAFAEGETRLEGLAELRVKECDRLEVTAAGLRALGLTVAVEGDDLIVSGQGSAGVAGTQGSAIATHLDHRIAMAFLTMGVATKTPVVVDDVTMIATSFPDFPDLMRRLGLDLEEV